MAARTEILRPPVTALSPWAWVQKNLFSTWYNALLTFLSLVVLYFSLGGLLRWATQEARWEVVTRNLRLFMVGQYPGEEMWRVAMVVVLVSALFGLSGGAKGGILRSVSLGLAAGFTLLALLPFGLEVRGWLLANVGLLAFTYLVARGLRPQGRWLLLGWGLFFPLSFLLLAGVRGNDFLPSVSTQLWGGLLLTFVLAVVGILASFPLGVFLALGRRSTMPAISGFSIAFIEVIRGVPLVTVLFMADLMIPLFLPEGARIDRLARVLVAIILFEAAYLAENVRGGLQAIPEGQYEAARALGLNPALMMLLIILPQALRNVIPALVSQFISLFKDTSLVAVVGLLDFLNIGRAVLGNPEFLGRYREVFVFAALGYWVFSYSLSWVSRRLEAVLGVGKR